MEAKTATVTMYEPQLDTWKDNVFEARAAVSVKEGDEAPVFGAVWIAGRFEVDRDERMVVLYDIKIPTFSTTSRSPQSRSRRHPRRGRRSWPLSSSGRSPHGTSRWSSIG
jgi:hypothetical protein